VGAGLTRPSGSPWAGAARCVRAASDLVATHTGPTSAPRTPDLDAVLGDPVAHQAALAQIGDLAATLLSGGDHLALRPGQAGVPWQEIRRLVPDLGEARAYARDLAGVGGRCRPRRTWTTSPSPSSRSAPRNPPQSLPTEWGVCANTHGSTPDSRTPRWTT